MHPTDQPADIQATDSLVNSEAEMPISGAGSPPEGTVAPARHHSVSIPDTRFPSGWVYVVAWDVIWQGSSDLSTMLCRSVDGDYFLRCRSGDTPDVRASIIPLSDAQAAEWFDQHPVHFAPRDARW